MMLTFLQPKASIPYLDTKFENKEGTPSAKEASYSLRALAASLLQVELSFRQSASAAMPLLSSETQASEHDHDSTPPTNQSP